MPDANHEFDIPVLTDVLVPGKPVPARSATQPEAPAPRAGDVPDLPPEVAPELAASGLPPVEARAALSTAYDAPAGAAGADALPVSRLAAGTDEARPPEAWELAAKVPAAPEETDGRGLAPEPEAPVEARAALPEATFVAPEPVSTPESTVSRQAEPASPVAAEASPLPAAGAAPAGPDASPPEAREAEPDVPDAPFVAPEPVVPPELAGAPEPLPEPAVDTVLNASEAQFVPPEPLAPQELAKAPEALVSPEPAVHQEAAALSEPPVVPEPPVPPELAAVPDPLASSAAPAHAEPSAPEAGFVAPQPAVPQEFAASPEPLSPPKPDAASVTSSPAPTRQDAAEVPLVRDDEHDAPDDASLAYALTNPEQAAEPVEAEQAVTGSHLGLADAPVSEASPADHDVVARTESALHAIEAMPPAAFAELTPFAADEPMPARFADHEAPPPVELQHGAPEPLPAAARPATAAPAIDAQRVAARLHGRVAGYLAGEGRALIDARCREVVQQHAAALAEEVSQQVLLALAPEIERWVSEAVGEALADREPPSA